MVEDIINPFKQTKKVDWAKKNKERLIEAKSKSDNNNQTENTNNVVIDKPSVIQQPIISNKDNVPKKTIKTKKNIELKKNENGTPIRIAKSFKIYPGQISRDFDKRVNKLQVKFDDLEYEKNFVDSGKYMMFLMSFAEKFDLHELYKTTNHLGDFEINKQEILNHFGTIFKNF